METNEDIAMQIQGILQTFAFVWFRGGGGGRRGGREGVRAPHHTIVCKIPRLWGAISSLTDVFLQDLAILLMLIKVFFSAVSIDPHLNFITPWKGLFAIAVFLTFYTVDRPDNTVCSDELEHYGIRGLALEWISYFSYRMQYVQFNGHRSLKN